MALPCIFQVRSVFVVARENTHQDAALADAFIVFFNSFLWNIPADERAYQSAGRRAGARAG